MLRDFFIFACLLSHFIRPFIHLTFFSVHISVEEREIIIVKKGYFFKLSIGWTCHKFCLSIPAQQHCLDDAQLLSLIFWAQVIFNLTLQGFRKRTFLSSILNRLNLRTSIQCVVTSNVLFCALILTLTYPNTLFCITIILIMLFLVSCY